MQVTKEHFVLRSARGQDVMGFESHDQATSWRDQQWKTSENQRNLILVRVTRTEEVLQ